MAHNINITNGKASFASAKKKAWHNIGTILDDVMTSEVAIREGGLDFEVVKVPNLAKLTNEEGVSLLETNSFSTVRTDTNQVLGDKLGNRYTIVQNKDAFTFFDSIVGEGEAIYETVGALGKGEIIFITAKLPAYISVKGDDIENYLLLTTTHDGSSSIQAMFTPVRVVCNNTLNSAIRGAKNKVNIRHTSSAEVNLREAHKVLGISNLLTKELDQAFNRMARVKINDNVVKDLIFNVIDGRQLDTAYTLLSPTEREALDLSTRSKNVMKDIYKYYFEGIGQDMESCKGTVWGAYNAITGYYQNIREYKSENDKMNKIIFGDAGAKMQKSLDLALLIAG